VFFVVDFCHLSVLVCENEMTNISLYCFRWKFDFLQLVHQYYISFNFLVAESHLPCANTLFFSEPHLPCSNTLFFSESHLPCSNTLFFSESHLPCSNTLFFSESHLPCSNTLFFSKSHLPSPLRPRSICKQRVNSTIIEILIA